MQPSDFTNKFQVNTPLPAENAPAQNIPDEPLRRAEIRGIPILRIESDPMEDTILPILKERPSPEAQEAALLRTRQFIRNPDFEISSEVLRKTVCALLDIINSETETNDHSEGRSEHRGVRAESRETLRQLGLIAEDLKRLDPEVRQKVFTVLVDNSEEVAPALKRYVEYVSYLFAPSRDLDSEQGTDDAPRVSKSWTIPPGTPLSPVEEQIDLETLVFRHLADAREPRSQEFAAQLIRQRVRNEELSAAENECHLSAASRLLLELTCPKDESVVPDAGVQFEALETLRRIGISKYRAILPSELRKEIGRELVTADVSPRLSRYYEMVGRCFLGDHKSSS